MIFKVILPKRVKKQLSRVPGYIADKLDVWIDAVEKEGLENMRRISGYHDEPLHGRRQGERSIRLNKAWRAIYVVKKHGVEFVEITEVSKHDY